MKDNTKTNSWKYRDASTTEWNRELGEIEEIFRDMDDYEGDDGE